MLEHLGGGAEQLWAEFLAKCKFAFHDLYRMLPESERSILPEDTLASFSTPDDFLHPAVEFQSHPVFQTTTLFVRQVLELLVYQSCRGESATVVEASGVCTGVLPAILASAFTSYLSTKFVTAAVDAFKISFWIGLRASLRCRLVVGCDWRRHPCLLTVFKLAPRLVEQRLSEYNSTLTALETPLRLSAIFDDDSVSVTGPGPRLDTLRSTLLTSAEPGTCRWAHVHGLYHGGDDMKQVSEQVMADASRCDVEFPGWASLHAPVRSTATGQIFQPDDKNSSLLQQAVDNIFVDSVNWKLTWEAATRAYVDKVRRDTNAIFRVIGLGPSVRSLLNDGKDGLVDSGIRLIAQLPEEMELLLEEDGIAIVGLSANFPGGRGLDRFWNVVNQAQTCVTEVPISRFNVSEYYQTDNRHSNKKPRKMGSKHGNFLDDPFNFDAGYFNISPREAKSMDPQQRLLLHAAVEALDDAGYAPGATPSFQQDSFGVYIGVATGDYVDNLRDQIDVYYSPGTLRAFLSGRISYAFGFKGPSMVLDTACSSSMVSIYHACKALRSGDCTAALAGGVNVISSPDMYLGLSRAHFLSPTGQCKPFDAAADGYCRAEGCGLVILKKLSQARAEGDHIYGIIRGIDVNQCGTAKSITHPDHETQAALFSQTLGLSRVSPGSIDVVEAHGTGTQAGDLAELSSLSAVFKGRRNPLYLGSVKGNIGHSEAASGVAGLIKLLLMMKHESIPRQASFQTLNPRLASMVAEHNFVIADSPKRWIAANCRPRRALLNNFGAAGSNAALVLEEAPRNASQINAKMAPPRSRHLLAISARSSQALERLKSEYVSFILANPDCRVQDVCYTASARRRHYKEFRWSAAIADVEALLMQIQRAKDSSPQRITSKPSKMVFAFAGQGGAHEGMGAELLRTAPVFRSAVGECDAILKRHGFPTVKDYLDPATAARDEPSSATERDNILIVQCACFVLQYALTRLLQSLGLTPDLVLGHSIGEYAALVASNVLQLQEALLFVARRAELMYTHCEAGASGMIACRMSPSDASDFLRNDLCDTAGALSVACHNSPEDCVIAGPTARLIEASELFKAKGIKHKLLNVTYGFHSSAMDAIMPSLKKLASAMAIHPPTIQIGSSVLGRLLDGHEALYPDYFVTQTRQPVLFMELLGDIQSKNSETSLQVIEIGPSTSTSSMFKSAFSQGSYSYLPSLRSSESSWTTITSALQSLYQSGWDLNWAGVYKGESPRFLKQLPCQQLEGQYYVVHYQQPTSVSNNTDQETLGPAPAPFALLSSSAMSYLDDGSRTFRVRIDNFSHLIEAHAVGGVPLCPASVYLELVLEALSVTRSISTAQGWYSVDAVSFEHPLVYPSTGSDFVEVNIRSMEQPAALESSEFSVWAQEHGHLYCSGSISPMIEQSVEKLFMLKGAYVRRQRSFLSHLAASSTPETFTSRTVYDVIFPRVVSYSEPFRTLEHVTISSLGLEGYGTFRLPDSRSGRFVCPPPFVDTMLHTAGFIANAKTDLNTACICVSLGRAVLPDMSKLQPNGEMNIYCSLLDVADSIVADAFVLDQDGTVVSFAEGMRFKKIRLNSFKTVLSRALQAKDQDRSDSLPSRVQRQPRNPKDQMAPPLQARAAPTPSNSMTEIVKEMIQCTCGVSWNPSSGRTLAELGIDSLLFIELAQTIESRFPSLAVPTDVIEKCQTADDLVNLLITAQGHCNGIAIHSPPSPGPVSSQHAPRGNNLPSPPLTEPKECDITSEIRDLFIDICGSSVTVKDRDASLASLGVDSLLSIELVHEIRQRFGLDLETLQEIISEMSINDIEALYAASIESSSNSVTTSVGMPESLPEPDDDAAEPAWPIEKSQGHKHEGTSSIFSHLIPSAFPHILQPVDSNITPTQPALCLFHDGSGLSNMYTRVKPLGRPVRGIFSLDIPAIDPSIQSMQDMASLYIERADMMSDKGLILCGWSFGGVLAVEVSRQLRQRGNPPRGVILIDSPSPIGHEPLPEEVITRIVSKYPNQHGSGATAEARSCIEAQFRRHASLLHKYDPLPQEGDVRCIAIVCKRTMDTRVTCGVSYPWLSDSSFRDESLKSWERLLGQEISILEVDCNHFEVFEQANVEEVSTMLKRACEMLN
ncbi:hypothetical protein ACJ41O_009098 [Fusarium nematophilum]